MRALLRFLSDNPDVEFDLWDLFRVDVADAFSGVLSVRRLWGLVERLLDEPRSRWRAKQVGGDHWREHIGWGPAEYLQASLIDAVQALVAVSDAHRVGKKPKVPARFYRPTRDEAAVPDDADAVLEIDDYAQFAQIEAAINADS